MGTPARQNLDMRVDVEPLDQFLELMAETRPCPRCRSERVTVRRELGPEGPVLRVECSDCRFAREVRAREAS